MPDKYFKQGFIGKFPLFAISWGGGGANLFLIWDEGRGVSRGHWRGGLGGLPTHLLSAGGMHSTVLLLRALQKGLWG